MGVVGKGRLRYALAAVSFGVFALAVVSAATARPAAKKPAPLVAKATCGTLTLQKGGSGMLRVKAAKGSMPVVSASLAGTKAKTKIRTISLVGATSFRYQLAKKQGQAEKVRVLVRFKKGKVSKTATIACAVRIGSSAATVNVAIGGGGVRVGHDRAGRDDVRVGQGPVREDLRAGQEGDAHGRAGHELDLRGLERRLLRQGDLRREDRGRQDGHGQVREEAVPGDDREGR